MAPTWAGPGLFLFFPCFRLLRCFGSSSFGNKIYEVHQFVEYYRLGYKIHIDVVIMYSRVRISTIAISAIFALVQDRSSSRLKYNVLHVIKFVLVQLLLVQSLL